MVPLGLLSSLFTVRRQGRFRWLYSISVIFLFLSNANAGTEFFAKVQELSQAGKYDAALEVLQDPKNAEIKSEEKLLVDFNIALLNFKKQNFASFARSRATHDGRGH